MNSHDDQSQAERDLSSLDNLGEQSLEELFAEHGNLPHSAQSEAHTKRDITMFSKIPVRLTLEVDSVDVMLGNLLNLNAGEVLPLDKKVGEPLDVRVNGELLARAEVVVVDGRYGLRLVDVPKNFNLPGTQD